MSLVRRGAVSVLLLCLPALAASAAPAAPDNPSGSDAKTTDAVIREALRNVVNEGADMYNGAPPRYTVPDYLGCHHLYEGALIAVRPLLANHPELQKAIDDGIENARNTPEPMQRAFVLRVVIDKVRKDLKAEKVGPPPTETTIKGKVTRAEKGKLTVKGDDGKEITFAVPADASVTIDGKAGKAEDVRAGDAVTVTAKGDEVSQVAVVTPPEPPPPPKVVTVQGKVVSAAKDKLTVSVDEKEKEFAVPADAKVMIDGAEGKIADAKPDGTATVTTRNGVVVAIDVKNPLPPPPPPDKSGKTTGKVTKAEADKITVKPEIGESKTFAVPDDAKITVDGKEAKVADVKAGDTATVTTDKEGKIATVEVKAAAAPPPPPPGETKTSGKVIKVAGDKISVLPATGEAKDFTVTDDTKVTLDGKDAKVGDVKADSKVTVTEAGGKVTKVEATAPVPPPPPPPPPPSGKKVGKVAKVEKGKLTLKDDEGKDATLTVPDDAKVTIDGKDGKLEDVKEGSTATVTADKDGTVTVVDVKGPAAPPPPPAPETLWDRLGAEKGVARVVDDFVNTAGKDPKVNFWRSEDPNYVPKKEDVAALKTNLVAFVSSATKGPINYTGKDMKDAHKGMKITDAQFDACAADLKAALEKNGVKDDDVKAVMAAVEGTRKDIVEVKGDDKPKPPDDKPKPPDDKPAETGAVKGKVVIDGQPLPAGTLTLVNDEGKAAYSAKITDGAYTIKDVKTGIYKITVTVDGKAGAIPAKYGMLDTTPLVSTIKAGENAFDLDLTK